MHLLLAHVRQSVFSYHGVSLTCPFLEHVPSDLEQLRKIRRRSPHDDTEAFTVFLRSDVEAKLVLFLTNQDFQEKQMASDVVCLFFFLIYLPVCHLQSARRLGKSRSFGPREKPPEGGGERVSRE